MWLCTFSLAVSVGAALLLPISIVSNEVLILYPSSYYVKWLNSSLIQGRYRLVGFLTGSTLWASFTVRLITPKEYFIIFGSTLPRIEIVPCTLLFCNELSSAAGLWNHVFLFSNLSLFVLLPFAYFFTESEGFTGYRKCLMARVYETTVVLVLLSILVLGMTYIMSALIDKDKSSIQTLLSNVHAVPQFLRDVNEEFYVARLEEDCVRRRLTLARTTGRTYLSPPPMSPPPSAMSCDDLDSTVMGLQNGALQSGLGDALSRVERRRRILDKQRHTSSVQRNIVYPLAMLLLLILTGGTVFMVAQNTVLLLVGIKALPLSTKQFTLGIASLSKLGLFGATLEIILIFYLMTTSSIGLYTLPFLSGVRPKARLTSLTHVIVNCGLVLILSSALPLLSRILGITNFDLLGDFGRIEWLGNFKIVLLYNLVFAAAATLCLVNKFTATVRRELYARLLNLFSSRQQTNWPAAANTTPSPTAPIFATATAEKED
uniref:Protein LMBR1L n=1 Tax=Timema shepardi TaxID=629360 RepID=A0A7R9B5V2_TIMSH|nr:unnamed protein product [Timema shepardi]